MLTVYLVYREQRKKYLITETIGYPREPGGGVVCQNHLLRNIYDTYFAVNKDFHTSYLLNVSIK